MMATSTALQARLARPVQCTGSRGSLRASPRTLTLQATFKTTRFARVVAQGLFEKDDMEVIEGDDDLPEPETDIWDDERFETFGQIAKFAVPIVAVGTVLVGAFASSQYNEGADTYMKSAPSDESIAFTVDAKEFDASIGKE